MAPPKATPDEPVVASEAMPADGQVVPTQPEPATGPVEAAPVPATFLFPDTGPAVLSVVPPAGSLTVPPFAEGGESAVITAEPAEVSGPIAARAREAAWLSGIDLKEH